ncbi:MAG: 3-oxoacyl-[acyl-carrier-protein] reductase [Armatimonadetes bacterium]|nr:3-oxoacyl-[acyl-carrier-protein] reductase [Armatimonadota bacterium]
MDFSGKAVVVTGGGRGIGRALALAFARCGADVAVAVSRDLAAAEAVAEEIAKQGRRSLARRADVSQWQAAHQLIEEATAAFGKIDVLVNNAGTNRDSLLLRMNEEDWDAVLDVNLKGTFHCTQAALRGMVRQRSGRIINITSILGLTGNPGQANYCASKAGIIGFTRAVAREVGSRGITVNAVAPGYIHTHMTAGLSEAQVAEILRRIPLGRLGESEDVCGAVLFLASDAAAYITGQVLIVDGGMTA